MNKAVVRDHAGVSHVAILHSVEEVPGEGPVIGALCEDVVYPPVTTTFTAWSANEIEDGEPDCMACIVECARTGPS